jgi:hypothetical protein
MDIPWIRLRKVTSFDDAKTLVGSRSVGIMDFNLFDGDNPTRIIYVVVDRITSDFICYAFNEHFVLGLDKGFSKWPRYSSMVEGVHVVGSLSCQNHSVKHVDRKLKIGDITFILHIVYRS